MAKGRSNLPAGADTARAERAAQACQLRSDGLTYRAIAARLGCSPAEAHRLVDMGIHEIIEEPAKRARTFEVRHFEGLRDRLRQALPMVMPDDLAKLASALVRVGERLARLQGLDAPSRVEVTEKPLAEMSDAELLALAKAWRK